MSDSTDPMLGPPQVYPQAYVAHSGHGSIGPVIGVLAVITILGAIAVIIGRLCSGRPVMGRVQYDIEGWVETKFASCISGRVDPPPPPARPQPPPEPESSRSSSCSGEETPGESGRVEKGNGSARPGNSDPGENV